MVSVFGKSITRPPKPRARLLEPVPALPWRPLAFGFLAALASLYALVRHYARAEPSDRLPAPYEIPAPELVPETK